MTTTTRTDRKHCPACDTTKDRSGFYSNVAKADGLTTYCKACTSAQRADHRRRNPAPPPSPATQPSRFPAIVELVGALSLDWARDDQAPCVGKWRILENPHTEHLARKLCDGCPLLDGCREWVVGLKDWEDPGGFRGGLTEKERAAERRRRNPPKKAQPRPRPRATPAEKTCAKCRETKPASEFYPQHGCSDGLDNKCRPCRNAEKREHARRRRAEQRIARHLAQLGRTA